MLKLSEADMNLILIRYGEIALKSRKVRSRFEKKLLANIKKALKEPFEITRERGRIYVTTPEIEENLKNLENIFGIVSFSPAVTVESNLEIIGKEGYKLSEGFIKGEDTFAVRTKRSGRHEFTSRDVAIDISDRIIKNIGAEVDLSEPDRVLYVETREEYTYIYKEIISGPGGLPLGTQGSVVSLISGGIDSPTATYLIMKRGCRVHPIFFDTRPYSDDSYYNNALRVAKLLEDYSIGEKFDIRVFPFGQVHDWIKKNIPKRLTCIFCKQGMLKIAERYALERGCDALVTGENLGQVASQTLKNMRVITSAVKLPVLRPLLTYDKNEISELARVIGSFEISTLPAGGCLAVPKYPATHADEEKIDKLKKKEEFEVFLDTVYHEWKNELAGNP